jgi:hypothetical protein
MLGAARASEYAGWWTGTPSFFSSSLAAVDAQSTYLDTISITPNVWSLPPDTRTFDNAGLANGAKGTIVSTFKWQAMSNYTWVTDSFRSFQHIENDSFAGAAFTTAQYYFLYPASSNGFVIKPARALTTNYISFQIAYNGYDFTTLTGNLSWDTYADRWLTLIVSYSSSAGDFANWTGTTGGTNYYQRSVLQDARTGELINQTDFRYTGFQGYDTNWANHTWSWNNSTPGSGEAYCVPNTSGANGYFDQTDWLTAAGWMCQGAVIDPMATVNDVQLRQYFVGQCFPETVNGARAWFNHTYFDTVVSGSNTALTRMLDSRATQTDDYFGQQTTANLTSPATDASIP